MRLLAIGDIHGCADKLTNLLAKVAPTTDDRVIFLGDYIDRGPDSKNVIDELLLFKREFPTTIFLRGNHEQLLLDSLAELSIIENWKVLRDYPYQFTDNPNDDVFALYLANGGGATLASYEIAMDKLRVSPRETFTRFPTTHLEFLRKLPTWYEYDRYFFVHAGITEEDPYGTRGGPFFHLWAREEIPFQNNGRNKIVVHGHTPVEKPVYNEGSGNINLDTGAVYGRTLTCCDLLSLRMWQV